MPARTERLVVLDDRRFAVRNGSAIQVLAWSDVMCVRAARNGACIMTERGEFQVREPISRIVAKLAPLGMVRIHRTVAVNGARIRQLVGRGRHRLTIVIDDRLAFDVGRQFQRTIRRRFVLGVMRNREVSIR